MGFRVSSLGFFGVSSLGFRKFRVWGLLGFRVLGMEFAVQCLGFTVAPASFAVGPGLSVRFWRSV